MLPNTTQLERGRAWTPSEDVKAQSLRISDHRHGHLQTPRGAGGPPPHAVDPVQPLPCSWGTALLSQLISVLLFILEVGAAKCSLGTLYLVLGRK